MKPVNQTRFGDDGNCVQACLASLFNLELSDVPHFIDEEVAAGHGWYWAMQLWSMRKFSLYPVNLAVGGGHTAIVDGYYCVSGLSHRGRQHMCIAKNGVIIHDPHPDNTGLLEVDEVLVFAKIM